MTNEELQELARRIAGIIENRGWVPAPVRPPASRPSAGDLPAWAGASQDLGDVAPGKASGASTRHRPAYHAVTAASRGAAAGRAPSPLPGGTGGPTTGPLRGMEVPVAISNRHIHICREKFETLFGVDASPDLDRAISQPGQFAAKQKVRVVGPRGSIEGVRIVGPLRDHTQVELAASDCRKLGIAAPVRDSGVVQGSAGLKLEGPAGSVELSHGAIIAAGHLHLSPKDSERLGLKDGQRVDILAGKGARSATLHGFLVRCGPTHSTEVHVDTDEAHALGLSTGDMVAVVGKPSKTPQKKGNRRDLVTERDVSAFASRGEQLTDGGRYILTPAARDRAKALGIWRG